ncbi:PHB depolymerase family esterase [Undibacterium sp. 5I1]|uniref:extracellular catalytic domain type 1 short-chain-length polyhydroxyalkanoate depolymerase n=1 Tax=unclassified Undibacterium TaxID=2630295 RepID=UPI002AB36A75|nr:MULTISPECIES: PHB depolymerase family esterase [unclassified Undibacterium]MDY7540392.1 PHB depolymerase family esterase [Undibacterium sp. 5I1]MEB0230024.1 PHB depolymerase family esterase [Undibacterium sp. 10I3]MEB0258044.1 PHB depolymerase family esterase [Undibacterium sp. 5I1]
MRKNKNWAAQLKTITKLFRLPRSSGLGGLNGLSKVIMPFKHVVKKRPKKLPAFKLPNISALDISKPISDLIDATKLKVPATWPYSQTALDDIVNKAGAAGQFLTRSYVKQIPSHTYKIFIPGNTDGKDLPLLIMLHGCTQNPDDFAAGTAMNEIAEEQKFIVAYPAQTQAANAQKCWNWFRTSDQLRGQGEPSIIAGITEEIIHDYPVDTTRVYIAGLSAGGAMAVTVATLYPDIYAAVGVHSGLPYASANNIPSALSAMRQGSYRAKYQQVEESIQTTIPIIVFHGDKDRTVNANNGDHLIKQNIAAQDVEIDPESPQNISIQTGKTHGGYTYSTTCYHDSEGHSIAEHWVIHEAGHAWSGGNPAGSYTDPKGPDASREMLRFFLSHQSCQPRNGG